MMVRIFLLVIFACTPTTAQEVTPKSATAASVSAASVSTDTDQEQASELLAIREASLEFINSFNNQDAKSVAALWTKDGDYIDENGRVLVGRAAIENEYTEFFKNNPGVKMQIVIDSLRLLSNDAAIEDGRAMLNPVPAGSPGFSNYTAVHVKVDGKWLMSTVRDFRNESQPTSQDVGDLEFLIGTWGAEEHGSKIESVCSWVANKNFVQRTYTVTHPDKSTTTGVQLIGVNPQGGHLQSWDFSPDGGHAIGVWAAHEGGWTTKMRGLTGNGNASASTNTLTRLDDNAYVWQSFQRRIGDTAFPDTDEVVMRRIK